MFTSRHFAKLVCTSIALLLGACASTPDYVPAETAEDYGHYTTRLAEDRYRIVFNGRRSTNLNTTRDYALLRAAELTLQEGNDWFQVVDRESSSVHRTQPTSGVRYERAYYVDRDCGLLRCSQSVRPVTYTSIGIDNRRAETKHSHALEIVMGKGTTPAGGGNYYDASSVAQSLWASM